MKKHLFLHTLAAVALTLFATVDSQAGVSKAAFLQGSQVEGGGEFLSSPAPISIAFNERSSIDPSAFDHDINNLHQLKITEAGDYLVLATLPVIAFDTPDDRPCAGLEVYVNGAPAAGSLGQSGYIRNQPRNTNMQSETSCHTHLLIPGLNAGDIIELKGIRTAQPAVRLQIQTASLYVEQVDGSRSAFSGLSDDALVGVNLNPDFEGAGEDPVELVWASNRKDSGFSHSNGNSEVQLSAGTYLVYVNVPLQRTSSSRLSPSLEILLDGQIVPGGQSRQGYNRNASGHIESSVHFAGVVEVSGNQTLTTQLVRYLNSGNTGNAVLPDGKQASIFVEKIGDSGVFLSSGSETTNDGDPTDWNAASKEQIVWDSASLSDGTYSQSGEAITVKQAGDYLLVYNDLLQSSATRPNPRITVEVNGEAVPGAETKTHYIRNSNGHNSASGTLSILLEGLSANDVVTVSTQREGQTGFVGIEEFSNEAAIVGLIKKNSLDPATLTSAPRVTSFGGDREGFHISIQQYSSSVVADSVSVLLNGEAVDASVSTSESVTSIIYSFPSIPDSLSSHVIDLSYTDSAGASQSASLGFTVADIYAKVSPSSANASVDTSSSGFVANVSQISSNVHGNNIDNANRQLAGGYSDADGVPYLNEAGPINATSWEFSPVDIAVVNLEQDGAAAGNFNENTGFADDFIPNIPGINESTDGIAAEFLTYLELSKGFHTLGVNSDDGFDVTIGPAARDLLSSSVGSFNGGRGASDSLFEVYVEEGGYYPTRLLWFEGTGGANVEFFSVVDGQKILINDRDNPNAIKAYKSAKTRPYISGFGPVTGTLAEEVSFEVTNGDTKSLTGIATQGKGLARLHAVWGLGQLARAGQNQDGVLVPLLADADGEVATQAAKVLGDIQSKAAVPGLIKLLGGNNARAQSQAAIALSKTSGNYTEAVLAMLRKNDDSDPIVRHAGMMALQALGKRLPVARLSQDSSQAVRLATVIALRREGNPSVAVFLQDEQPHIVLEAARAIADEHIDAALPTLAKLTSQPKLGKSTMRRALNAHYRLGNAAALAAVAVEDEHAALARGEALNLLAAWANPSGRDRISGLWRPIAARENKDAAAALKYFRSQLK